MIILNSKTKNTNKKSVSYSSYSISSLHSENKTIDDPNCEKQLNQEDSNKSFICHLCNYEAIGMENMDSVHGFLNCERCQFTAEDKQIMKKHMTKHTGGIIYTCYVCEFESTRQAMLDDHKETKQTNNNPWWYEHQPTQHHCEYCEKTFKNLFVKRYHNCTQETKYKCPKCEFMAVTLDEHLTHIEEKHQKTENNQSLKCDLCEFIASSKESINCHKHTMHKKVQVDIKVKDQVEISCDKCEYKCRFNIQLKKHTKLIHEALQNEEIKYKCETCNFSSNFLLRVCGNTEKAAIKDRPQAFPQNQKTWCLLC